MKEREVVRRMMHFADMLWIAIALFSMWNIDIAVSVLSLDSPIQSSVTITNGFSYFTPVQKYHVGLWGVVASILWFAARTSGIIQYDWMKSQTDKINGWFHG